MNNISTEHWRISQWFPNLNNASIQKLQKYNALLGKFNKTLNLVSPKTLPFADAIHFADSILAINEITKSYKVDELYDFGSGNGFPGIVFSILYPDIPVTLVDSDERKCEFLKTVKSDLDLKNLKISNQTIESLPADLVKFGICRGLSSISKAILATRKLFKVGGVFFHMKGEGWASEIAEIPTQLCSFWTPALVSEYRLPIGEIKFAVVKTEKIAN